MRLPALLALMGIRATGSFQLQAVASAAPALVAGLGLSYAELGLLMGVFKQRIESALRRNAEIEAREIKVDVLDNGAVRLEGRVRAWSERRAAERACWSAAGVKTVEDRITIG